MKNKLSKAQTLWLVINIFALLFAIYSLGSDVWEAYFFIFFVSTAAQGLFFWRSRK